MLRDIRNALIVIRDGIAEFCDAILAENPEAGCYVALLALAAGVIGAVLYLKLSTYNVQLSVDNLSWKRSIFVEKYKQVPGDAVKGYEPTDAYNKAEYTHSWTTEYICGSYESCSGSGKDRFCTTHYEWCTAYHSERRVKYIVDRWVSDHDLTTTGVHPAPRVWPTFVPHPENVLGNEREGSRREWLTVNFKRADTGGIISQDQPDEPHWLAFGVGLQFNIEINRSEEPQWATLKGIDKR